MFLFFCLRFFCLFDFFVGCFCLRFFLGGFLYLIVFFFNVFVFLFKVFLFI